MTSDEKFHRLRKQIKPIATRKRFSGGYFALRNSVIPKMFQPNRAPSIAAQDLGHRGALSCLLKVNISMKDSAPYVRSPDNQQGETLTVYSMPLGSVLRKGGSISIICDAPRRMGSFFPSSHLMLASQNTWLKKTKQRDGHSHGSGAQ